MRRLAIALLAISCAGSCDEADTGAADARDVPIDAGVPGDAGAGGPGFVPDRVGFVNVIEGSWYIDNGDGFEILRAVVTDGPRLPRARAVAIGGGCGVYAHDAPSFCDPACVDDYCSTDDTCVPFPLNVDAGDIEVSGLVGPLTFTYSPFGYEYQDQIPLSGDMFDDSATIEVTATGADASGFALSAGAVVEVESSMEEPLDLEAGTAEQLTWVPEQDGRIQIGMRYGWHGIPYQVLVVCETDDTGEFDLPAEIVDAYIDRAGSGEVNYWWIARFNRDVATTPAGPIELFVANIDYHAQLL